MKRFVLMGALVWGALGWLTGQPAWADDAATVLGSWKLSITTPEGQTFGPVLKLAQDGDKLSGTFTGDDGSENPIADATFANGELAFSVSLDFGGTPLTTKYRGQVKDGGLAGTLDYDLGGQTGTLEFSGARLAAVGDVAGKWNLVASSPDGQTFEPSLELKAEGDALSGQYTWIDGTTMPISDVKLDGDQLTFRVAIDFGGQAMTVDFKGKVAGDDLSGTADYDLGGQTGTVDFTGKRAGEPLALAGKWNIVASSPDGQTFEPTLDLVEGAEGITGKLTWIDGTAIDLTDGKLEGNNLSFTVSIDFGGQPMTVVFKGAVEPGKMTGTADYDLGGQTGTVDFTGTPAAAPVSLAGRWNVVVNSPDGQTFEPTIDVVEGADGKLTGKFNWIDGTSVDINDASLEGDKLVAAVAIDFGGQALSIKLNGTVDGSSMVGTVDYDLGGQTGSLDFTATKAEVNVAGHWNAVASSPDGQTFEPTVDLEQGPEGVTGKFTWIDGTTIDLTGGKLEGNALTFTVAIDFGGQAMNIVFKSTVDGDSMTGTADYDLGGQTGTVDFTATRGAAASPLAGDWDITLSTEDGQTFDVKLAVKDEAGALSGQYTGPAGEAPVSNLKVDGERVTFTVERERDGQKFTIEYDGKLSGDSLEGTAKMSAGPQSGDLKFTGRRAAQ